MRRLRLPRRSFLRGLGGIALGLPMLEIMQPTARAGGAAPPKRYVYAFGGCSIGMNATDRVTPLDEGVGYTPTRAFQPLVDLGVQDDVTVASGMLIPWDEGSGIPPGGRRIGFHSSSPCPLTSGMRSDAAGSEDARGPTSDQIIGDFLDPGRKVLTYRVQPAWYRGDNETDIGARGRISARMDGGTLLPIDPVFSPSLAYSNLFSGFDPGDPAATAATEFLLKRRRSVIDLVADDTETLMNKLGAADRIRMERHLEELRALESRIELIEPMGACMQLPDPGLDPDIGPAVNDFDYASGGAYSNEELRATVLIDLIHMAFTCDIARSASLMFTYAQCFMNMNQLYGYASDLHEISHYSMGGGEAGATAMADCIAWHVKHWGRLVQKLGETQEVDGSSLLDHTALVLAFEGGWGHDPESPANVGEAHSTENMVALVGGRAGGLNAGGGRHIRATNRHPVELVNTAMHAVGFDGALGEVTSDMDDLLL
jgi:hypothetical protein